MPALIRYATRHMENTIPFLAKRDIIRSACGVSLVLLVLAGCLEYQATISVKPDGSGRFEQIVAMTNEMMAQLADTTGEKISLLDEEQLHAGTAALGKGVKLRTAKPHSTETHDGFRAVYTFPDINALNVSTFPDDALPTDETMSTSGDPVVFELIPGEVSELRITLPPDEEGSGGGETAEPDLFSPDSGLGADILAQIFGGMRIAVHVIIEGEIVETNASHVEGSRIILYDVDLGRMIADPAVMEQMAGGFTRRRDLAAVEIPGVVVEPSDVVVVRFR